LQLKSQITSQNKKKVLKQVHQQACKTQIPPYGLKQRHRPNSDCPTEPRHQIPNPHQASPGATACIQLVAGGRIHPGSNAAAVTPCEPKFTKMGEDLSG